MDYCTLYTNQNIRAGPLGSLRLRNETTNKTFLGILLDIYSINWPLCQMPLKNFLFSLAANSKYLYFTYLTSALARVYAIAAIPLI